MHFKHDSMRQDWDIIDKRLKQVLRMIDAFSILCFDKEIMITSLYRPEDKDSQHSFGKAADIRTKWYTEQQTICLEIFLMGVRAEMYNWQGDKRVAVEPHQEWKNPDHPKYKYRHLHVHVK